MITTPIPASQIVSVDIDLECLTVTCPTLEGVLQAIVSKLCVLPSEVSVDFGELDFKCLAATNTQTEFNQLVIDTLCGLPEVVSPDTITLNYCVTDGWDYEPLECFVIAECGVPVTTPSLNQILQALISRTLSYQDKIIALNDRIAELEDSLSTLQLTVTQIQSTCC